MTFMEFLNENSIIAWIIMGIVVTIALIFFARIFIARIFKRIKKIRKSNLTAQKEIVYKEKFLNHDLTEFKDLDKKKFYYEAHGKDFFAKKGSFFLRLLDLKGYKNRKMKKKHPDKIVLIRMEMNNGQYREFPVIEDEKNGFKRNGNKYIFDLDARYYVIDSNIWAYDFHESLTMPVKRRIPVNEIKSSMEHSNITEVENAINPVTLERFIKSEIAQGILQGAMIGKLFKVMLILIIITLVINGIDLVIDLMDSGVMAEIMAKAK